MCSLCEFMNINCFYIPIKIPLKSAKRMKEVYTVNTHKKNKHNNGIMFYYTNW